MWVWLGLLIVVIVVIYFGGSMILSRARSAASDAASSANSTITDGIKDAVDTAVNNVTDTVNKVLNPRPLLCPAGSSQIGALCYEDCGPGYSRSDGNIEFCTRNCPEGWEDSGIGGCKKPTEWKNATSRLAGGCPAGQEKLGLLCYETCPAGTVRQGLNCNSVCPEGYRDDGLYCAKPASYGRGVGYGFNPFHWLGAHPSPGEAFDKCVKENPQGCEWAGDPGIAYPKCAPGYRPVGCCVCEWAEPCPADFGDIGVSCKKPVAYTSTPNDAICPAGMWQRGDLCYEPCKDGWTSDGGNICYKDPPADYTGKSSLAFIEHETKYSPGVGIVQAGVCPDGQSRVGALCYDN